jgi:hypothetical protein
MASSGKPKTTMAKLQREARLRERRSEKAARKEIRKQAQLYPSQPDELTSDDGAPEPEAEGLDLDALVVPPTG